VNDLGKFKLAMSNNINISTASLLLFVGLLTIAAGCGSSAPASADDKYFAAQAAAAAGNHAEAVQLLDEYIAASPVPYGYLERAKAHVALGDDAKALADCEAGLERFPDYADLKWFHAELQKPPESRFKGKQATAPSIQK
jgi:tetratricopeptide (TPR) repeat protein